MISQDEALKEAKKYLSEKQKYAQFAFQAAAQLRLPGGWRIPFEVSLRQERISEWLLILFVSDDGSIEIESDTITRVSGNAELYQTAKERAAPELPPLEDVKQALAKSYPVYDMADYIIETTEPVWLLAEQNPKGELTRYWRLILLHRNGTRTVAYAGYKSDHATRGMIAQVELQAALPIFVSEPQIRARRIAHQWTLGRTKFRHKQGYLAVNLKGLIGQGDGESSAHSSLWTIWSCIFALREHTELLGYAGVDLHRVMIEIVELSHETAKFDHSDKIPIITLPRKGGWPEELTIILHEFGHALWWLLYTRSPKTVRDPRHAHILDGIQEGFCDYVAATLVAGPRTRKYVRIGRHLVERAHGLPRHIGGCQPDRLPAFSSLTNQAGVHDIGLKWANFLWAIRAKLGHRDADRVILRAHLKPLQASDAPTEPFAAYVQSLEHTAEFFQIPLGDWDTLVFEHGLDI